MDSKSLSLIFLILWDFPFTSSAGLKNTVELEKVQVCPGNDQMESSLRNLKFTRINNTHSALSVDFAYARDIDEKTGFIVRLDRWSDGRWVEWPFLPKQKDMCKTMNKLFPSIFVEAMRSANVANPDKCPIPAGEYHLENHIFDFSHLYAPIRLGKFRITVKITDDAFKDVYYCMILEVKIEQQLIKK
ncbi:uncharacterized protein LOC123674806 [Harmonia axyridis]|uniref:uncharacterized protein LOC123674806 n=1 Tax=Harmonia axyridis TaxID=115357 RepID=UPI001E278D26|nr:uncharacterized protein LOC123674806 [Harmonia axyridis]